jgi:hypothetical protein
MFLIKNLHDLSDRRELCTFLAIFGPLHIFSNGCTFLRCGGFLHKKLILHKNPLGCTKTAEEKVIVGLSS